MRSSLSLSPVYVLVLLSVEAVLPQPARAQVPYDTTLYGALEWRMIGPYRGGRSTAVAGVPGQPYVYYFGGTGGGVWKTVDGGMGWEPATSRRATACGSPPMPARPGAGLGYPRRGRWVRS
jgi:hypothetical protein